MQKYRGYGKQPKEQSVDFQAFCMLKGFTLPPPIQPICLPFWYVILCVCL